MENKIEHPIYSQSELDWFEFYDRFIQTASENGTRKPLVHGDETIEELIKFSPELNGAMKMLFGGIDPYVVIVDLCASIHAKHKFIDKQFETGEWSKNMIIKNPQHG